RRATDRLFPLSSPRRHRFSLPAAHRQKGAEVPPTARLSASGLLPAVRRVAGPHRRCCPPPHHHGGGEEGRQGYPRRLPHHRPRGRVELPIEEEEPRLYPRPRRFHVEGPSCLHRLRLRRGGER